MDSASTIAPVLLLSTASTSNAPNPLTDQFICQDGSGNHDVDGNLNHGGEPVHHFGVLLLSCYNYHPDAPLASPGDATPVN